MTVNRSGAFVMALPLERPRLKGTSRVVALPAPPGLTDPPGSSLLIQVTASTLHEDLVADTGNNRQEELGLTIDLDDRIHRHPTLAWNAPENHFPALHMRTRMKRPCGVEDNRANDIEVDKVVISSDQ